MNREEAIKWLKAIEKKYIHGGDEGYDNLRKIALHMAIESLEQPERPKGEWIHVVRLDAEYDECPYCHEKEKHAKPWFDYCPHCGADLRGEKNEQTY